MRKPTIATNTAAAATTTPWKIGPSKMRIKGVVTISKARNSGAGNMLTALIFYQARSRTCMVIVARSSIARHNGPFGIATTIVIFIEYTI
jgi:hypothetical protein